MSANFVGFSRLKGVFQSGLNYRNYSAILNNTKNQTVGSLPAEMINAIKTKKLEISPHAQQIKDGFGDAAKILQEYDEKLIMNAESTKIPANIIEKFVEIRLTDPNDKQLKAFEILKDCFKLDDSFLKGLEAKAAEAIKSKMAAILPEDAKVKLTHIGCGMWKNSYKVEFTNSNGEKIFTDRALGVYKKRALVGKKELIEKETALEEILKVPREKIVELTKNLKIFDNDTPQIETSRFIGNFIDNTRDTIEFIHTQLSEIYKRNVSFHGACAEANAFAYLKKALGHDLKKTNVVKTDLIDIKNNYSLAPLIDGSMPKPTSEVKFLNLGLNYTDYKEDNLVADRIVDLGGLVQTNENLKDKTVLKYFKKVLNRESPKERQALYKRYEQLIENPKTPDRNKIKQALELIKSRGLSEG